MFSAAQGFLLWKKIKSSQFLWACQLGAFTHVQLSEHLWIYWCYWISTLSNTHVRIWWNQCGGMVASHCHSWSRWWCDVIFFDELSQGFMTALPNTFSVFCFFWSWFKFAWSLMYFQEVFSYNHIDMFSMVPCYWYELQLWWSSSGAPEQFLVGKTCSTLYCRLLPQGWRWIPSPATNCGIVLLFLLVYMTGRDDWKRSA